MLSQQSSCMEITTVSSGHAPIRLLNKTLTNHNAQTNLIFKNHEQDINFPFIILSKIHMTIVYLSALYIQVRNLTSS
jgi:hypothetical protein